MKEALYFLFGQQKADYLINNNIISIVAVCAAAVLLLCMIISAVIEKRNSIRTAMQPSKPVKFKKSEKQKKTEGGPDMYSDKDDEKDNGFEKIDIPVVSIGTDERQIDEQVHEEPVQVDMKPGMIPNPLPMPKVSTKTDMDYDIEVAADDDYDIK